MGRVACLILDWLKHKLCTSQKENKPWRNFIRMGAHRFEMQCQSRPHGHRDAGPRPLSAFIVTGILVPKTAEIMRTASVSIASLF